MTNLPSHVYSEQASKHAGRGLFASKAIEAGKEIFRIDRPLVSVLDSPHMKDACSNCFVWVPEHGVGQFGEERGRGVKLRACQGCKVDRYCSTDCQAQSWRRHHRLECKIFAKLYPNVLPNTVRIVVQLLLRKQAQWLFAEEWQEFLKLQSHIDEFRSSPTKNSEGLSTWHTIELMSQAASSYCGSKEPIPSIQTLTARVLINTLTLTTPTFDPLGLCISPLSSLLNHSCTPNTAIIYSGPTLTLRSLASIPPNTELTISYVDTTSRTSTRLTDLRTRYFFTCTCVSCLSNSTNGIPDPQPDPHFETLSVRAIGLQNEAASKAPAEAAQLLKSALNLFTPYQPYRQPHPTILHTAFLHATSHSLYALALRHALRSYMSIDPILHPLPWHPVRVVRKWVLLRLVIHIAALAAEKDESVKALERFEIDWRVVAVGLWREVEGGVGKSHGVGSGFEREVRGCAEGCGLLGEGVEKRALGECWGRLRKVAMAEF